MPNEFGGAIPLIYEKQMVPMVFEHFAPDMAKRVIQANGKKILETAAGTGILTRKLVRDVDRNVQIVASDISDAMIDLAQTLDTSNRVDWYQADAMNLPFESGDFDVVVAQFGAMFFSDKQLAFREARRVLRSGGTFLFSVWDEIGNNEFVDTVCSAIGEMFPSNSPTFAQRVPHGYHSISTIKSDLQEAGFQKPIQWETITRKSVAPSARTAATAFCLGTPLHHEIKERNPHLIDEAIERSTKALEKRFGLGPITGDITAHIINTSK